MNECCDVGTCCRSDWGGGVTLLHATWNSCASACHSFVAVIATGTYFCCDVCLLVQLVAEPVFFVFFAPLSQHDFKFFAT